MNWQGQTHVCACHLPPFPDLPIPILTTDKGSPSPKGSLIFRSIFAPRKLLFLLKSILVQPANGADEILGQILPGGAGLDAVVGITEGGVVLISTGANVFHNRSSFRVCKIQYGRVSAFLFHASWRRVGSHHTTQPLGFSVRRAGICTRRPANVWKFLGVLNPFLKKGSSGSRAEPLALSNLTYRNISPADLQMPCRGEPRREPSRGRCRGSHPDSAPWQPWPARTCLR